MAEPVRYRSVPDLSSSGGPVIVRRGDRLGDGGEATGERLLPIG
jgi:hypothetical protein